MVAQFIMFKDKLHVLAMEDYEVGCQVSDLLPNQQHVLDIQRIEKDLENSMVFAFCSRNVVSESICMMSGCSLEDSF